MVSTNLCTNCMTAQLHNGVCPRCGYNARNNPGNGGNALPQGFQLENYTVGRVLGSGGFGITYLAWDNHNNCRVALKELFPSGAVYRSARTGLIKTRRDFKNAEAYFRHVKTRFCEEAQTIANLSGHPEIIRIFDQFNALGTCYYSMEFLEGEDLKRIAMRQGRMSWKQLEDPTRDTLRTLQILHSYGLIHRDISPDNIFLQRNGRAKLIDFGSVRWEQADHFTAFMKQDFAPYEQYLTDGDQGPWTDIYSLCASVYYLAGGKLPTKSGDRRFALEQKKPDPLIPLQDLKPDVPAYVQGAVMRGLNILPENRFRTAEEMINALALQRESRHKLRCIRGQYAGRCFSLPSDEVIILGRGNEASDGIVYPMQTPGISRRQCAFYTDTNGNCYVQDLQSKFGTRLNGQPIEPMVWCRLALGVTVTVGNEHYQLL